MAEQVVSRERDGTEATYGEKRPIHGEGWNYDVNA
jgi:hypothetical protein